MNREAQVAGRALAGIPGLGPFRWLLYSRNVPEPVQITFLGTAGSWPTKERNASAIAVDLEREVVLLDCGEGTQRQLF
ncbi:Ribonuclease Z, partial [mine drainage metagenome]